MWHKDKEIFLRKLRGKGGNRNLKAVLDVKARAKVSGPVNYRLTVFLLIPFIVVMFAVLGIVGWLKYFARNERFMIERVIINGGKRLAPELVKEWTGIREGVNIFSFSLRKVRSDLLKQAANLSDVVLVRKLPNTVEIEIVERAPLARVSDQKSLAADARGMVFAMRSGLGDLPAISGHRDRDLTPGVQLEGKMISALELLEANRINIRESLPIRSVNIDKDTYFLLELDGGRIVKFSWKNMHDHTDKSRSNLSIKLAGLARTLRKKEAGSLVVIDATFDDKVVGEAADTRN